MIAGIFGDIENQTIEDYTEEEDETALGIDDAETINNPPFMLNESTETSKDLSDKIEDGSEPGHLELMEEDNQTVCILRYYERGK